MVERAVMVVMVRSGGGGGCEGERVGFVCCFSWDVRCQCNQLQDLPAVKNARLLPSILGNGFLRSLELSVQMPTSRIQHQSHPMPIQGEDAGDNGDFRHVHGQTNC